MKRLVWLIMIGMMALYESSCADEFEDIMSYDSTTTSVETVVSDNSEAKEITSTEETASVEEEVSEPVKPVAGVDYKVYGTISLNTVDFAGNTVTNDILSGYTLTMINIWAPWCGPCVGEMPELESLYENYKDKDFQILGAVPDIKDYDMQWAIDYTGVKYPIIAVDSAIDAYSSEYVPTTFFVDEEGNVLTAESLIGASDYSDWEKIVKKYLEILSAK